MTVAGLTEAAVVILSLAQQGACKLDLRLLELLITSQLCAEHFSISLSSVEPLVPLAQQQV
jgi:hypothetical protein